MKKSKRKQPPASGYSFGALAFDVVIPVPLEECARRLEVGSAQYYKRWQRAQVDDDGYFVVERLVDTPRTTRPTFQFMGKLESVEGGTRVRGAITDQTDRWLRGQRMTITALNGVTVIFAGAVVINPPLALLAAGYGLAAAGSWLWYLNHTRNCAPDLVQWIYGVLAVPAATSLF